MNDENPSLIRDVHIVALDRILNEFAANPLPSMGFFLRGEERCDLGVLKDGAFESFGVRIAREYEINRNGRQCDDFKLVLGAMLATYVGDCEQQRKLAALLDSKSVSGKAVLAFAQDRDTYPKNQQLDALLEETWDQSVAKDSPVSLTKDEIAKAWGTDSSSYVTADDDVLFGIAGTYVSNARTGEGGWHFFTGEKETPLIDEAPFKVSGEKAMALESGSALEVVSPETSIVTARWIPIGEATTNVRSSSDGSFQPTKERRYLMLSLEPSENTAELTKADLIAKATSVLASDGNVIGYPTHYPGLPDFFQKTLIGSNPLRDKFFFENGIDREDLPEEIAAVLFRDRVGSP